MLAQIETLREKLNEMAAADNVVLYSEEILNLSQKLDKLVFVSEAITIQRSRINYKEQLQKFLSPELYNGLGICY